MGLSLGRLQTELKPWQAHNFPNRPAWQPLLGIGEEVGELDHAFLKAAQKIRITEDHRANIEDSLADAIVYMADFANALDIDLETVLERTWNEVKQRDWIKYPEKGRPLTVAEMADKALALASPDGAA